MTVVLTAIGTMQSNQGIILMHYYGICSKFTTKPRLRKIIHIIWTCNTVCTWVFVTSLDLARANIDKFLFSNLRLGGDIS